jgi:hypothetical protein
VRQTEDLERPQVKAKHEHRRPMFAVLPDSGLARELQPHGLPTWELEKKNSR